MYQQVTKTTVGTPVELSTNDFQPAVFQGLYARLGKRVLDVLIALVAAPFVAPLIGILALIVRRDGGPAFYGQPRVGRGGRRFVCWKLRTMVADADDQLEAHLTGDPDARAEWNETQKLRDDPRVTRVGAILRAASFDELPQILNILLGDMSFVGPRPFTPEQQHLYHGSSYYALRPGLSGYWQVEDRNDVSFASRATYDARYAQDISLATDLGIIARTIAVVVRCTGR